MCIIWRETEEYIECAWYGMRRREAVGKEWEEQRDEWTPSGRIIHECAYLIAFTSGAKEGIICFILLLSIIQFSSVQSLRQVWLFTTPWISAHQASLSITSSQAYALTSIDSVMPSNVLISFKFPYIHLAFKLDKQT